MKIFRLLATSLLVGLSMGVSSCNNEVKSSDLEDRVDENGKYIVYKKGDNNPFTGISIPTKNPNMKVFYESGIVIKKEQVTDNGYKRVTTYDSDGITKQNNTTYYDANGNVCTQKIFWRTYIIRILKYMDIFSVFTAGFFIGGFIIVIIMCSFKD